VAALDDILGMLPIDEIARSSAWMPTPQRPPSHRVVGRSSAVCRRTPRPRGSAVEAALGKHAGTADAARAAGRIDVDAVDTADGEKIRKHVFGGKEQEVAQTLTNDKQTAGIDFSKLLPVLAPIVMGMLAKGQQNQSTSTQSSGGGITDLIGGLLGGGGSSVHGWRHRHRQHSRRPLRRQERDLPARSCCRSGGGERLWTVTFRAFRRQGAVKVSRVPGGMPASGERDRP
jgi:hypothetical protein